MKPILLNAVLDLPIESLNEFKKGISDTTPNILINARIAAEAHKRARYRLQNQIKPGMTMKSICDLIESATRTLLKGEKCDGVGFPTGLSINDCAAHDTVNPGDEDIFLKESDVLKVDFGTHVEGTIMDSAFTVCFDPKFENLLKASQEATNVGIQNLSADVRVSDIGGVINEVISSYEIELDGITKKIIPVENLNGHSIGNYVIHSGITIPQKKNKDMTKIQEDQFYALETFATTGNGFVRDGKGCSHFIFNPSCSKRVENPKTKKVFSFIKENIGTLPFCPRYVDYMMGTEGTYKPQVDILAMLKILDKYPPLLDVKGSYVAQFEHTVYVSKTGREILTKGEDY